MKDYIQKFIQTPKILMLHNYPCGGIIINKPEYKKQSRACDRYRYSVRTKPGQHNGELYRQGVLMVVTVNKINKVLLLKEIYQQIAMNLYLKLYKLRNGHVTGCHHQRRCYR